MLPTAKNYGNFSPPNPHPTPFFLVGFCGSSSDLMLKVIDRVHRSRLVLYLAQCPCFFFFCFCVNLSFPIDWDNCVMP